MVKALTYDILDYNIKLKIRQLQVMGKKNTRQINDTAMKIINHVYGLLLLDYFKV